MKKTKRLLTGTFATLMAVAFTFGAAGCNNGGRDSSSSGNDQNSASSEAPVKVTMSIEAPKDTISKGETITLTVKIKAEGTKDESYTWSVSDPSIVKVEGNVVSVIADVTVDKRVTVTARSNADKSVSASQALIVKAPVVDGRVGELTTDMIKAIGDPSITVTGTVTDIYQDFHQTDNSSKNEYDMTVKMEDGAWSGSWWIKGSQNNVITDMYRRGTDQVTDQDNRTGHSMNQIYIDKNNTVASTPVKDYMSYPSVWEEQHLYNHLADLGNDVTKKFVYDVDNELYEYKYNPSKDTDDLYLLTYLSYSLTPMLEDTLSSVYLKVKDGAVTELWGQTDILYYGSDTREDADAMMYTQVKVSFSDVGETEVKDPTPYAAPQNADKLKTALDKMKASDNYTYRAVDVTTSAPSSGDDYELTSASGSAVKTTSLKSAAAAADENNQSSVQNNTSATGTVGCLGKVTQDAILFANTIKYSYSLDDKNYRTEYTGYKQINDEYYDEFAYSSKTKAMYGTKRVKGNIIDSMPQFDFSENIFKLSGTSYDKSGTELYTFELRETSITRDVAMEISAYRYASSANASTERTLKITVDANGNIVETEYPYSYSAYTGFCKTTYSNIGNTVLDEGLFNGYVARPDMETWDQYITKYFSTTHSTLDSHEEKTDVVLEYVFGAKKSLLPTPKVLMNIFGDNISGPFYDYKEKGKDADGNTIYSDYLSITTTSSSFDENARITNYDEIIEQLDAALGALGYTKDYANTDTSGGETGRGNRYVSYVKGGDIQIVVENNFTKHFWIYFYQAGDWTLKK